MNNKVILNKGAQDILLEVIDGSNPGGNGTFQLTKDACELITEIINPVKPSSDDSVWLGNFEIVFDENSEQYIFKDDVKPDLNQIIELKTQNKVPTFNLIANDLILRKYPHTALSDIKISFNEFVTCAESFKDDYMTFKKLAIGNMYLGQPEFGYLLPNYALELAVSITGD